jgi:hypothetical protein
MAERLSYRPLQMVEFVEQVAADLDVRNFIGYQHALAYQERHCLVARLAHTFAAALTREPD